MGALERFNSPAKVQRIGNDSVYGTGSDGTVIIASNTSLTRDMYYSNLTINNGVHLNTNGFKVFVKNTLTVNGSIGVASGVSVSTATVAGTANIATSVTNSIGGTASGGVYTASQVPASVVSDIENILRAGHVNTSGSFLSFTGGAGGGNGSLGTVTPGVAGTLTPGANGTGATESPSTWTGQAGSLPSQNAGYPGGPGNRGTNGTNGSAGIAIPAASAGSTPPAASAGAGARGGPVVVIVAKNISGTGVVRSEGSNSTAGGSSATGTGAGASATGTGATNGANGSAGSSSPSASIYHAANTHASYTRGGDNATIHYGTPALPRGPHVTEHSLDHAHGSWTYTAHDATPVHPANSHHGSSPHFGGASTSHAPVPPTSVFYAVNNVNHTAGNTLGHDGAVAHTYVHTSAPVGHNHYAEADHHASGPYHLPAYHYKGAHEPAVHYHGHAVAHRGRHDLYGYHGNGNRRQAGTQAHAITRSYPGGVGGPAGSAGSAGSNFSTTAGTNGSTTAGTAGQAGGGGGIIIITEAALSGVTTSASGGANPVSGTGSSGAVYTILNQ